MFEIVNGRTDDGRTLEHGYTISSPYEPEGSGELSSNREPQQKYRIGTVSKLLGDS